MFKPEQVLIIDPPHELKFTGNLTLMRLKNPTNDSVYFKIKTTAPKRYCVRPNSGVLAPKECAEVVISPQPNYFDPNEKCKHKFMVQSIIAPPNKELDQAFKDATPEQIMDTKLKCIFEMPAGTGKTQENIDVPKSDTAPKRLASEESQATHGSSKNFYEQAENEEKSVDVQKVLEENTKMKQENILLKEELKSLRVRIDSTSRHSYDPPQKVGTIMKPTYLAMVIGVAIFGIIIGKFIM